MTGALAGGLIYDFSVNGGTNFRAAHVLLSDNVMMPLLRLLDPERAHDLAIKAMSLNLGPKDLEPDDPLLRTEVFGKVFPNPVGLAAGFDKHGMAINQLMDLGFGFVEVGSVTPEPQPGNPKPRMFRFVLVLLSLACGS